MIYLDITKEKKLLEFLKEYMLLAEIAYIESNAPVSIYLWVIFLFMVTHINESFKVMAILPSILSAATQGADMQEIQEAALFKESGSRILQMLLYVGLKWVFNHFQFRWLGNSIITIEKLASTRPISII